MLSITLNKQTFVEGELTALLKKLDERVSYAAYHNDGPRNEYVIVGYIDGTSTRVNVTWDSPALIAVDIIRRVML